MHLNDLQGALHVTPPMQHVQQVLGHRAADEERALAEGVCGGGGQGRARQRSGGGMRTQGHLPQLRLGA